MPAGRPSEYTDELAQEICDALALNGSIRKTAKEIGIDRVTIYRWTEKHPEFATAIAHAKQMGYDERAEKAVQDAKEAKDAPLGRLAFDAERWYLSKIDPKRYGDKTLVGSDPENPLPAGFNVTLVKPVT